jgi:hypothetical protein
VHLKTDAKESVMIPNSVFLQKATKISIWTVYPAFRNLLKLLQNQLNCCWFHFQFVKFMFKSENNLNFMWRWHYSGEGGIGTMNPGHYRVAFKAGKDLPQIRMTKIVLFLWQCSF